MNTDIESLYWFIVKCASLIAVLICIFAILLYKYQNRIIYMPVIDGMSRSPSQNVFGMQNPSQIELAYEDVYITTEDNIQLHGWMAKQQDSLHSPTIVYFHENAGNIGTRVHYMKEYSEQSFVNIILVAYRGYSNSQGEPSEQGLMKDAKAILNHVFSRTDIDRTKIFIHGRSLGGAVAIYSASELNYPICGVIIENTFTSLSDMADVVFRRIRFLKEIVLRNFWPSINRISKVKKPIMFIQCLEDELIPPEQMTKLFNQATSATFKHQYLIPNGTHNNSWGMDPYSYFIEVNSFIQKCIENKSVLQEQFIEVPLSAKKNTSPQIEQCIEITSVLNEQHLETNQLLVL